MDTTRQLKAVPEPTPELKPPPATAVTLPQAEATGDSDSDVAASAQTAGRSSETDEDDDAESCSGGGNGGRFIDSAKDESDDDVAMEEVDMSEVDSKMALPWWHRTDEYAARDDGGCCAPAVAAEGANAAESNRLFWEACIAHGY